MILGKRTVLIAGVFLLCGFMILLLSVSILKGTAREDVSSEEARMKKNNSTNEQELSDARSQFALARKAVLNGRNIKNASRRDMEDEISAADRRDPASEKKWVERRVDLLESEFISQGIDTQWALKKEEDIADFMKHLSTETPIGFNNPETLELRSKIKMIDSECKKTMCRVEVSYGGDEDARNEFLLSLGRPPFDGPSFATLSDEGKPTVAYIAREGHSLPRSM